MAGQFDLPSWLTTQTPWSGSDSFIKGSQAGSAIAANRLRAQALYAEVQQNQQRMDLAQREFVTRNEASTLHNEVVRTKLAGDAADFNALREWWPKFQASSDGEIDMPQLHNENTMLKVSAAVAEKRSKIGQAAFAELMATPGFDLANPEHQKQYFELLSKYKNIPAKLGPDGVMGPIRVAENLKRLRDEADSRIASRTDRTALNKLIEERRALLTDSTIDVNDARIAKYDRDIALEERRLAVQEGNLGLREREITGKETRLGLRERYLNERNAVDREEKAKLKAAETSPDSAAESDRLRKFYNLKRREVTSKYYGPNAPKVERQGLQPPPAPALTPPTPIAPGTNKVSVIAPDGRRGFIPESQLEDALKAGYTKP